MPKELIDYEFLNQAAASPKDALIDLWFLANDRQRTAMINGRRVPLKRGQLAWAQGSLARRWRWSPEKVKRFLVEAQDERLITFEASKTVTIITVIDYTVYNADSATVTGTETATEPASETGTESGTETVLEPASEAEQKWEVGSGKLEGGRRPRDPEVRGPNQFPEVEVPGLDEFVAACSVRGIPAWYAENEHAWRSERPAQRWPLGANWQTAVTSTALRWRAQGAPLLQGQKNGAKKSVWETQTQLVNLREQILKHPANENSAAFAGEPTDAERQELEDLQRRVGELEKAAAT